MNTDSRVSNSGSTIALMPQILTHGAEEKANDDIYVYREYTIAINCKSVLYVALILLTTLLLGVSDSVELSGSEGSQ